MFCNQQNALHRSMAENYWVAELCSCSNVLYLAVILLNMDLFLNVLIILRIILKKKHYQVKNCCDCIVGIDYDLVVILGKCHCIKVKNSLIYCSSSLFRDFED